MTAEKLRDERRRRGWTQTRVSALTGIAASDISSIENGRRAATAGWRRRLSVAFDLPEDALFSARDAGTPQTR